jgi:hypothetical protein
VDYTEHGSVRSELFLPSHIGSLAETALNQKKIMDVVFIGHYTKERAAIITALAASGIEVFVYGGWPKNVLPDTVERGAQLLTDEYYRTIGKARIALAFYSRLNRDQFTRRCFEIPACGTVIASEHTTWMSEHFSDGDDSIIFSDAEEAINKIKGLLNDSDKYAAVRKSTLEWSLKNRSSVLERARQLLQYHTDVHPQ